MFLKELGQEAVTTRKMLAIVPEDKLDWAPHRKSMTIRRLAAHIAELPGWVAMAIKTDELDFANNPYESYPIKGREDLLAYHEKSLKEGTDALNATTEAELDKLWTLRNGEEIYSKESKADVIRMSISQTIHHRAQLGVFLRLLDIRIPGSYGPSADEMGL
jgi:uncharacterized damage-inducible protein DinB